MSANYQIDRPVAHHASSFRAFRRRKCAAALLFALCATHASAAYNAAFCQSVASTLNIQWREISGPEAPCTAIEITDGSLADAADGSITMSGTSASNGTCIGLAAYAFTLSPDTQQLIGSDTMNNVPMTLTRGSGEQCFVGTWTSGVYVFEAHIWAGAFPLAVPAVPAVPGPGVAALTLLAAMIGAFGGWFARRRA